MTTDYKTFCYPIKIIHKSGDNPCGSKGIWIFTDKEIGEAGNGSIYKVCCNDEYDNQKCDYVLKYIRKNRDNVIEHEVEMQQKCSELNLCIPVIDSWNCNEGGIIISPILNITVRRMLIEFNDILVLKKIMNSVIKLLNKLHNNGIYHGDCHLDNIMCKFNDKPINSKSAMEIYKDRGYKYFFIDMAFSGFLNDEDEEEKYRKIIHDFAKLYSSLATIDKEKFMILKEQLLISIRKIIKDNPPPTDLLPGLKNIMYVRGIELKQIFS